MIDDAKVVSRTIESHTDLGMPGRHGRSLPHVSVAGVAAIVVAPTDMVLGFSKPSVEIGLITQEFLNG
jgi:hypothetical protein